MIRYFARFILTVSYIASRMLCADIVYLLNTARDITNTFTTDEDVKNKENTNFCGLKVFGCQIIGRKKHNWVTSGQIPFYDLPYD